MRLLIHDYPGHAFPIQLSRHLAGRGHEVLHLYAGYNVTPRGLVNGQKNDPASFAISPIYIREPLNKYKLVKRWRQEREYGRLLKNQILAFQPEVVISANTPLDAQKSALAAAKMVHSRFVFWLQDVIGLASKQLLQQKLFLAGKVIGEYYLGLEKALLRDSDHVVLITDDFLPLMKAWQLEESRLTVVPNWAVLEDLPVYSKENDWSRKHGLGDKFCFMYTGTMGLKHNPDFLLQLALHFQNDDDIRVVVISEGPGAAWLAEQRAVHAIHNLLILDFQPFEQLPAVMGTADALIALLEPDAGIYSVPSKVLAYLCAQRPLLLAVPYENLAARIVSQHDAGLVASPHAPQEFVQAADLLYQDAAMRAGLARNARQYAEANFNINEVANKFERILHGQAFVHRTGASPTPKENDGPQQA